jgi:hypothetical protein
MAALSTVAKGETMHALADLKLPKSPAKLQREVLDQVRERTLVTCQRLGVIREDRMSLQKYLAGRFELLAALAYPDADVAGLVLCNDFNTYLFYVDDQADEDDGYGKNPELLQRYLASHIAALRDGDPRSSCADPAIRLLLDIRARLLARTSRSWFDRFVDSVRDYMVRGTLESAKLWTTGSVPSFAEYERYRGLDSAVYAEQVLIEMAGGGELPRSVLGRAEFIELNRLCSNVVAFTNDLVSYPKEVREHGSSNNLLRVIMVEEQLSFDDAVERVVDIVNDDVASFEATAESLASVTSNTVPALKRYVAGQRGWMSGNLLWSLASGRYADAQSPFRELRLDPHSHGEVALHAR